MAAATCLSLLASVLGNDVIPLVLPFVEQHIRSADWHYREASVMAFGSMLDGPTEEAVGPLLDASLPHFIAMMQDSVVAVKDTTAWTLGRISEFLSTSIKTEHLGPLVAALIDGLGGHPKVAANCAWVGVFCFFRLFLMCIIGMKY